MLKSPEIVARIGHAPEEGLQRYAWGSLTKQQVGRYGEYFVKMELTMFGFEVYSSEVDERGVDFIARRRDSHFIEVQVKSLRVKSLGEPNYVFMHKSKFALGSDRFLALVLLRDGKSPDFFLIPSTAWQEGGKIFASRDYEGLKSRPEWGLRVSRRSMPILENYRFECTLARMHHQRTKDETRCTTPV
jgi:hypothetical protein